MLEIPPVKNTDAEDVVWGLQTAEALWKRGERIDALVWLRRAAQAAGDANDDDRALELARFAAELTEWVANNEETMVTGRHAVSEEASSHTGEPPLGDPADVEITITMPPVGKLAPPAGSSTASPHVTMQDPIIRTVDGMMPDTSATLAPAAIVDEDAVRPSATSVLPAEKVHAGMFDPWAEARLAGANPSPPARHASVVDTDEEEVVTSVRPAALSRPDATPASAVVSSPPPSKPASTDTGALLPLPKPPPRPSVGSKPPLPPKAPPPLPPRARPPGPTKPGPVVAAPVAPEPVSEEPELISIPPSAPDELADVNVAPPVPAPAAVVDAPPEPTSTVEPAREITEAPPAADPGAPALNLDNVDAFADLPDDARSAFAAAATLHSLAEGEEIGAFALAYVVSGCFDVAATVVDAPAVRLADGAVLRARGTTDENVPIRLISAAGSGVIATWSDASVEEAFRSIPWVEEDLRAAADRVQTLVGITIGPIGERLDASIREEIVSRLTMRPLIAGEVVVKEGDAVPGLLLVGIGELELVKAENVVGAVSSGDFLFPTEVLGAGSAPSTARAGAGGALVMFGDRRIAQELLVTCPPLLELFAGM